MSSISSRHSSGAAALVAALLGAGCASRTTSTSEAPRPVPERMIATGATVPVAAPNPDTAPPPPVRPNVTSSTIRGEVVRDPMGPPPMRNMAVAFADGMLQPESVLYDAAQDVYFVTNINGQTLGKDGNGFIARLKGDGSRDVEKWVSSGSMRLDAPKGMAIVGDTLWVADIDMLRGFNRRTGAVVGSVDLKPMGAVFLNDVALGPDGAVYVTDTQMAAEPGGLMRHAGTDRVFRIGPDRQASIALQSDRLGRPNGIAWDAPNARFVVVPMGGDTLMTWKPGDAAPQPLAVGPGRFDGVVVTPDGRLFVASQATAAIHELVGGRLVKVIDGVDGAADIGYDARHNRLGVPLLGGGRVVFYELPPR